MELLLEVAPGIDPKEVRWKADCMRFGLGFHERDAAASWKFEDAFQVELEENVRFETVEDVYKYLMNHKAT